MTPKYSSGQDSEDNARGGFYHLPFAKQEVDSISNLFFPEAKVAQSWDKNEWFETMDSCKIFHYAGHAIVQGENAFLALSGSEDGNQIQLTADEIGLTYNPLELVVLSACETGLGELEQGEGIRSLGRSFMDSGAKATIISLWNVNDKSTAEIMVEFYKNLKKGYRKDEALRESKISYLANADKNNHPYFWSAFIPAGDMSSIP